MYCIGANARNTRACTWGSCECEFAYVYGTGEDCGGICARVCRPGSNRSCVCTCAGVCGESCADVHRSSWVSSTFFPIPCPVWLLLSILAQDSATSEGLLLSSLEQRPEQAVWCTPGKKGSLCALKGSGRCRGPGLRVAIAHSHLLYHREPQESCIPNMF